MKGSDRAVSSARPPGFVDLQVNGFGGCDFSSQELTPAKIRGAFRGVLASGTAAFLPTLVSTAAATYERNLPLLAHEIASEEFRGRVLGLHLEGPFLAPDVRVIGAHREAHLREANTEYLSRLHRLAGGAIRLLTVSPEIDGCMELIRAARSLGIHVSLGHSFADAEQMRDARSAGAGAFTHFGNALPNTIPRHENPIVAGLTMNTMWAMVICDGHHLPRTFLSLVRQVFGVERMVAVSDLSPVCGLPPGRHRALGQDVTLDAEGAVWNERERHFVGSATPLLDGINRLLDWSIVDVESAWRVGFYNPLAVLGLDGRDVRSPSVVRFDAAARRFQAVA